MPLLLPEFLYKPWFVVQEQCVELVKEMRSSIHCTKVIAVLEYFKYCKEHLKCHKVIKNKKQCSLTGFLVLSTLIVVLLIESSHMLFDISQMHPKSDNLACMHAFLVS